MKADFELLEMALEEYEDKYTLLYKRLVKIINDIMENEDAEEIRFGYDTPYWSCPTDTIEDNGTLIPIVAISTTEEDKLLITIHNKVTDQEETFVPQYGEINLSDIASAIIEMY